MEQNLASNFHFLFLHQIFQSYFIRLVNLEYMSYFHLLWFEVEHLDLLVSLVLFLVSLQWLNDFLLTSIYWQNSSPNLIVAYQYCCSIRSYYIAARKLWLLWVHFWIRLAILDFIISFMSSFGNLHLFHWSSIQFSLFSDYSTF